jgi:hypothetical protein
MKIIAIPISVPVFLSVNNGSTSLFSVVLRVKHCDNYPKMKDLMIMAHIQTNFSIGMGFADFIAQISLAKEDKLEVIFHTAQEDGMKIVDEKKIDFYKVFVLGFTHDFEI